MRFYLAKRHICALFCIATLTVGCGGSRSTPPASGAISGASVEGQAPFAEGPIGTACLVHRRAAASRARCGCIQAAADRTLTQSQQQRGTGYFSDPGQLQEVRQSDSGGNERFWQAWSRFAQTAESLCARV